MSPKSTYSGEAEEQRTDALSIEAGSILNRELKRARLPASPETFSKSICEILCALANSVALAKLCIKELKSVGRGVYK